MKINKRVLLVLGIGCIIIVSFAFFLNNRFTQEEDPSNTFEIQERMDASYERWLASEVMIGISMQYPDFTFENVYLGGETEIAEKTKSKGVYVVFHADGEEKVIHSVPLNDERTESGTKDLYSRDLGFATFDEIALEEMEADTFLQAEPEEFDDLISQSLLVSLYEH